MKFNPKRAFEYLGIMGRKAQLDDFVAILFGRWWPGPGGQGTPEPGEDPVVDPDPIDPTPPPTPDVLPALDPLVSDEVWAYFVLEHRWGLPAAKRDPILAALPAVRICHWSQRRANSDTIETIAARLAALVRVAKGRPIYLGLDAREVFQPGLGSTPSSPKEWMRVMLSAVKAELGADGWARWVRCVEITDEPPVTHSGEYELLCAIVQQYRELEIELGLSPRPTSCTIASRDLCDKPKVPGLDILAAEGYSPTPTQDAWLDDATARGKIRVALQYMADAIQAAGYRPAAVLQTYARNYNDALGKPVFGLPNMRVLYWQAREGMLWCEENRARLAWVGLFSAARESGFASPEPWHQPLWDVHMGRDGRSGLIPTFARRLGGSSEQWPMPPDDPRPGQPVGFVAKVILHALAGQSPVVSQVYRWGLVQIGLTAVDALGRKWDGFWGLRRKAKILAWRAVGPSGVSARNSLTGASEQMAPWQLNFDAAEAGYAVGIQIQGTPSGEPIVVSARGHWDGKLLTYEQALRPVKPAEPSIEYARCDVCPRDFVSGWKPIHSPAYVSNATGRVRGKLGAGPGEATEGGPWT